MGWIWEASPGSGSGGHMHLQVSHWAPPSAGAVHHSASYGFVEWKAGKQDRPAQQPSDPETGGSRACGGRAAWDPRDICPKEDIYPALLISWGQMDKIYVRLWSIVGNKEHVQLCIHLQKQRTLASYQIPWIIYKASGSHPNPQKTWRKIKMKYDAVETIWSILAPRPEQDYSLWIFQILTLKRWLNKLTTQLKIEA